MTVNRKKLLVVALYAGEIMLKNGAETYRVEDTIVRICKSKNLPYVDAYVTPTGIFMSVDSKGDASDEIISYVKRIKSRGINLNKVAEVNNFSRQFVESDIPLNVALSILKTIDISEPYSKHIKALLGSSLSGGLFALLFGGSLWDFLIASIVSIFVSYSLHHLDRVKFPPFLSNAIGGALLTLLSISFSYFTPLVNRGINLDTVITGALMTLVPGVAITNAFRDSIAGDLVSGLARATEAVIIATSIAFGVGFILKLWFIMLGGRLV